MTLSYESLLHTLDGEGVRVVETRSGMSGDRAGWYCRQSRTIGLHPDLLDRQRLPVLLHEWFHHLRGDDGPQSAAVEALIDERVAEVLVDASEYAFWEAQYGWHTGGIAHALGLPRWVVQAYRRHLQSSLQKHV